MGTWRAKNDVRSDSDEQRRPRGIEVIAADSTPPHIAPPLPRSEALHEELPSIYERPTARPASPQPASPEPVRPEPYPDPYAIPVEPPPPAAESRVATASHPPTALSDHATVDGPSRAAVSQITSSSASEELDRAEQLATAVMNIAELRIALRELPAEALARDLIRGADAQLLTVTRLLTNRLQDPQSRAQSLPPEAETALAVVEWLVSTLVPGSSLEELSPELRAMREPNPAA